MKFNNVVKTDDGKLNYDYDPDTSFLVGDEKLNSWLSDHKNNVMENGTNVQEEEAVADLTSVQETEGETEENTTEAAVEAISVETPRQEPSRRAQPIRQQPPLSTRVTPTQDSISL